MQFSAFNLENFTPDRFFLHGHCPWCPRQIWGMLESRTTNSSRCTTAPNSASFHSRKIIGCSQESFQKESGCPPQARKNCLTQATQVAYDSKKSERQCIVSLNSNPILSMYSEHPNNCLLKEAPDSRLPSKRYLKLFSISSFKRSSLPERSLWPKVWSLDWFNWRCENEIHYEEV